MTTIYPKVNHYAIHLYNHHIGGTFRLEPSNKLSREEIKHFNDIKCNTLKVPTRERDKNVGSISYYEKVGGQCADGSNIPYKCDTTSLNEFFNEKQIDIIRNHYGYQNEIQHQCYMKKNMFNIPISESMSDILDYVLDEYDPKTIDIVYLHKTGIRYPPQRINELFRWETVVDGHNINTIYGLFIFIYKPIVDKVCYLEEQLKQQVSENELLKIRIKELEEKNNVILNNLDIINKRFGFTQ